MVGISDDVVVVVYHVTIVAIGHGFVEEILAFLVLGCVLRTAGNSIQMITKNTLRMKEKDFFLNILQSATAFDLMKCLQEIRLPISLRKCVTISQLPTNMRTMHNLVFTSSPPPLRVGFGSVSFSSC